ncbi:MAG TPA: nitroreductase family protein [Thermoanaerobaculia bacterium]|nr:nitroreductase family protein [Thermoanaerobaculia bacterium]
MDVLQAIRERRAVRSYTDEVLDRATVERLIHSAVQAPSARDLEPWAFVIFEGRERLRGFSEEAKRVVLHSPEEGESSKFRAMLSDPDFNIFYGAPVLVVICATSAQSQAAEDCCLAAQNLMLAAHAEGVASCPIGFARPWLNLPATKVALGIPRDWIPVFPVILGRTREHPASPGRRAPNLMWR